MEQTTSARFALPQPSFLLSNALHPLASALPPLSDPVKQATSRLSPPLPLSQMLLQCTDFFHPTPICKCLQHLPWIHLHCYNGALHINTLAFKVGKPRQMLFFLPTEANPHYCRSFHPLNCPASKSSFIGFGQKLQSISKVGQ